MDDHGLVFYVVFAGLCIVTRMDVRAASIVVGRRVVRHDYVVRGILRLYRFHQGRLSRELSVRRVVTK